MSNIYPPRGCCSCCAPLCQASTLSSEPAALSCCASLVAGRYCGGTPAASAAPLLVPGPEPCCLLPAPGCACLLSPAEASAAEPGASLSEPGRTQIWAGSWALSLRLPAGRQAWGLLCIAGKQTHTHLHQAAARLVAAQQECLPVHVSACPGTRAPCHGLSLAVSLQSCIPVCQAPTCRW